MLITTLLAAKITDSVSRDCLGLRIFRNADDGVNDTLLVDACLVEFHLHFMIDKLGQAVS